MEEEPGPKAQVPDREISKYLLALLAFHGVRPMQFFRFWNSSRGRASFHDEVGSIPLSLTSCTTRCTSCLKL